jgi:hypothetical protein
MAEGVVPCVRRRLREGSVGESDKGTMITWAEVLEAVSVALSPEAMGNAWI